MTNGQLTFAAGVAAGLANGEAYAKAFPKSKHPEMDAGRLMSDKNPNKPKIIAEIQRIRGKAEENPGSNFLSIIEKRNFLARLVRAQLSTLPDDSDLWQEVSVTDIGIKRKLPCKLKAIASDNELSTDGADMKMVITINRASWS